MILPIDPIVHQQLERAVEQCGLSRADVAITYEDVLQSEQILVRNKSLSDEQLRCLSKVERASPHPIVAFENGDLTKRSYELQHQQDRADAKEWLRERGLLTSLPAYDPQSETMDQFARRLEEFCGIEPGSTLIMHELGILTLKPEWLEPQLRESSKLSEDKFSCLMNAILATGLNFGFVGNEYYPEDEQP